MSALDFPNTLASLIASYLRITTLFERMEILLQRPLGDVENSVSCYVGS